MAVARLQRCVNTDCARRDDCRDEPHLAIAIWTGSRGVATIDEIAKKLDVMKEASIEQSAEIRALRVESNAQQRILADHEARVRILEAAGRVAQPITRP